MTQPTDFAALAARLRMREQLHSIDGQIITGGCIADIEAVDQAADILAARPAPATEASEEYMTVTLSRDGLVQSHNAFDADFDEMVRATETIIRVLSERLSNRKYCPYSHGGKLKNAELSPVAPTAGDELGVRLGEAMNTPDPGRLNRDWLGEMVRETWVRWAEKQPNPKPSWLVPYARLDEPDKEADRQIGVDLARIGAQTWLSHNRFLLAEIMSALADRAALQARAGELETENERLSTAVCSGVLGDLLTKDEGEALWDFVKSLRVAHLESKQP